MVKLIVHIGHGKTGSSSIQESLLKAQPQLEAQGIRYLGLMLEHARNTDRPNWQFRGGSDLYFDGTPTEQANAELLAVLQDELQRLQREGVQKAIWSNEWLAQRGQMVLQALHQLLVQGWDIEVQCYIRRHDKWILSAYSQWGLKDKNYSGPIQDFPSWFAVRREHILNFLQPLEQWDAVFSGRLKVFNFDAAGDVVQHFMRVNGIAGVKSIVDNVSKAAPEAAAQAVFNSRKTGQVIPDAFNSVAELAERGDENRQALPELDKLLPSEADLQKIVQEWQGDIARLNWFLSRSGEPVLSFDKAPSTTKHPSAWEMDQYLLKLIFGMREENLEMKSQIRELQTKLTALQAERNS